MYLVICPDEIINVNGDLITSTPSLVTRIMISGISYRNYLFSLVL